MYPRTAPGAGSRGVSYLVIIGGALIAVQGILDILNIVPAPPPDLVRPYLLIVGVVSVISGVLAMVAGWLILQRKKSLGSPSQSSSQSSASRAAVASSSGPCSA